MVTDIRCGRSSQSSKNNKRLGDIIRPNIFLPPWPNRSRYAEQNGYYDFRILQNQLLLEIGRQNAEDRYDWTDFSWYLLMAGVAYFLGPLSDALFVVFVGFFTILILDGYLECCRDFFYMDSSPIGWKLGISNPQRLVMVLP
jgi:hypothetical protein